MKQIITALLAAFLALWFASAHAANDVTLRTAVIVEDNYVTLGDLFENAGPNAGKKIAYSPAPGKRATFDAKWLYKVASAYKLNWRPFTMNTHAVVERASQVIQRDEIHDALVRALRDRGAGKDIEIELAANAGNFHVAADTASTVGIEGLSFDAGTGRFVATVAVPANDPAATRTRVTGRIYKLVSVPMLAENKRRGDVIRASDIQWRDVRASEIRDHVITDDEDLVGMAAKREIKADSAVHVSQLRRPVLIAKGALVTIELAQGGMSLSTQGKAQEEGSLGDIIKVTNIRSNKLIEAKVNGNNRVAVHSGRADMASN
jgi:flagella basal body P-ring formation protein FlgA